MGNEFPNFDRCVRRPFAVEEQCYDCTEFYDGCNARPANPPTRCRDYFQLPDVMPGTYGQVFPASRMSERKEPRLCRTTAKDKPEPELGRELTGNVQPTRMQSPAAHHKLDGKRRCDCGAALPKRRRCCDDCQRQRRKETISRRRSRKQPPAVSHADSDVPVARSRRPPIEAVAAAHNYSGLRHPLPAFYTPKG
jgi:hypothetical protein